MKKILGIGGLLVGSRYLMGCTMLVVAAATAGCGSLKTVEGEKVLSDYQLIDFGDSEDRKAAITDGGIVTKEMLVHRTRIKDRALVGPDGKAIATEDGTPVVVTDIDMTLTGPSGAEFAEAKSAVDLDVLESYRLKAGNDIADMNIESNSEYVAAFGAQVNEAIERLGVQLQSNMETFLGGPTRANILAGANAAERVIPLVQPSTVQPPGPDLATILADISARLAALEAQGDEPLPLPPPDPNTFGPENQ